MRRSTGTRPGSLPGGAVAVADASSSRHPVGSCARFGATIDAQGQVSATVPIMLVTPVAALRSSDTYLLDAAERGLIHRARRSRRPLRCATLSPAPLPAVGCPILDERHQASLDVLHERRRVARRSLRSHPRRRPIRRRRRLPRQPRPGAKTDAGVSGRCETLARCLNGSSVRCAASASTSAKQACRCAEAVDTTATPTSAARPLLVVRRRRRPGRIGPRRLWVPVAAHRCAG